MEAMDHVGRAIDELHAGKSAATRRQMVIGAAGLLGGLGLLGVPGAAGAQMVSDGRNGLDTIPRQDLQSVINIAATAEVLATIVNTVGSVGAPDAYGKWMRPVRLPDGGKEKISASAVEELGHLEVLVALGGKPLTTRIWVPDAVFQDANTFLKTVEVGDQIFINAYLIATTLYAQAGLPDLARAAAEIMAVEAVHRAFARDLRGQPGNDRMFMKLDQPEKAVAAPNFNAKGFHRVADAVTQLQAAGFGFGAEGAMPGRYYELDKVKARTPNPSFVNTREPE